tara:strand:- start:81 stop:221 length:141 start_codon:yes stop_codon:yes gene_type:complete
MVIGDAELRDFENINPPFVFQTLTTSPPFNSRRLKSRVVLVVAGEG